MYWAKLQPKSPGEGQEKRIQIKLKTILKSDRLLRFALPMDSANYGLRQEGLNALHASKFWYRLQLLKYDLTIFFCPRKQCEKMKGIIPGSLREIGSRGFSRCQD